MPGNTAYEAYGAFVTPLASAISTVARTKITCSEGGKQKLGAVHTLYLGPVEGYIQLKSEALKNTGLDLEFRGRMRYEIINCEPPEEHRYRVTTRWYAYSVRTSDGAAVFDYHWHPDGQSDESDPHVHWGHSQLNPEGVLAKSQHWPSGRVTLESIIRRLIKELEVKPLCADWAEKLDEAEGPHLAHRTWGGRR
jgi:hypothetical protein